MLYLTIQTLICLLSTFLLARSIALRGIPKVRFYIYMAVAACFYSFGYLLEMDAKSVEAAYMATRIQYVGIAVHPVLFYLFVRDFNNRPVMGRKKVAGMMAFPAVVMVLANLYPESRLYFKSMQLVSSPSPRLEVQRGVFFHLNAAFSLVFMGLCAYEIVFKYPGGTRRERKNRTLFLLAAAVPAAAVIVYAAGPPLLLLPGSGALVVSLVLLGRHILLRQPQDWLLYSREHVVESMGDGYILLDSENHFTDANGLALNMFPALRGAYRGQWIGEIKGLPREITDARPGVCEITVGGKAGVTVLRASVTPVKFSQRQIGKCVLLYDITELSAAMNELRQKAAIDSLTGLLNRGEFMALAGRDFMLHRRIGRTAAFVMADIDDFKYINDTFGHQCGDTVLKGVADAISRVIRSTDISGRYGGEEFCAFLPATDLQGAALIAEKIRAEIGALVFVLGGQEVGITVSIGVSVTCDGEGESLKRMVGRADAALYRAKRRGKNRVEWLDSEPNRVLAGGKISAGPQDM